MRDLIKKEIEVEIGEVVYNFDVTIYYNEWSDVGDYENPPYSEVEVDEVDIESEIGAVHSDGREWIVEEGSDEERMVLEWVDFQKVLEESL